MYVSLQALLQKRQEYLWVPPVSSGAETRHKLDEFERINELHSFVSESKKISNDQELIQSDPISCPQNQKGNN